MKPQLENSETVDSRIFRVLRPNSVAIVGASNDPSKRGARAIAMLRDSGYEGRIVPINPKEQEIMSYPCFPSLMEVPHEVDLALVCTPARLAPDIVQQCGARNIPGAVILAGGFSEASEAGAKLERDTVAAARAGGVRIVGPNTAGMFDAYSGCNLMGVPGIVPGHLGVLSQSGNVLLSLVAQSIHQGAAGFSTFVGLGNEADIQFHEYLRFFEADERTRALIIYLEGLKNGVDFLSTLRDVTQRLPVVVYKAGRTAAGESAARSHSGALAGDYAVASDVLRQAGAIVVERSDELFPVADILSRDAGKPARRVALLSEGGGPISQAADALVELGLELPVLNPVTEAALKKITPNATQLSNPVDSGGGTDPHPRYFAPSAREILADDNVDALMIVGYFGAYQLRWGNSVAEAENQAAEEIVALKQKSGKPIVVQCHYADFPSDGTRILRDGGIPVIASIEMASRLLGALSEQEEARRRIAAAPRSLVQAESPAGEASTLLAQQKQDGYSALLEPQAMRLLGLYGLPVLPSALVRQAGDVASLPAALLDRPLALKVVSRDILHKSDAGGVMLHRKGADDVTQGVSELLARVGTSRPKAAIDGVLAMPMADPGIEILLGLTTDAHFGRIVVFGLGGTAVEVFRDVAFRTLPLSREDVRDLVASIKAQAILNGARGGPVIDREKLVDLIVRFSEMALAHPELREVDLNPVIVNADGCTIVDARILLG